MKTLVTWPLASWHVFPLRFFLDSITLPFMWRLANFTNIGLGFAGVGAVPCDEARDLQPRQGQSAQSVRDEDEEANWHPEWSWGPLGWPETTVMYVGSEGEVTLPTLCVTSRSSMVMGEIAASYHLMFKTLVSVLPVVFSGILNTHTNPLLPCCSKSSYLVSISST